MINNNLKNILLEFTKRILPLLVSIIIGIIITLIVQFYAELKQKKQIRNNVLFDLELLSFGLENQINRWEQFADELRESFGGDELFHYPSTDLDEIFIPDEELIRTAFLKGSKRKKDTLRSELSGELRAMRSTKLITATFKHDIQYYIAKHEKFVEDWNSSMSQITEKRVRYWQEYAKKHPDRNYLNMSEDPFLFAFNMTYVKWQELNNNNRPTICMTEFILPMSKICNSHMHDERSTELLINLNKCRQISYTIEGLSKLYADEIDQAVDHLRKNKEMIDILIK